MHLASSIGLLHAYDSVRSLLIKPRIAIIMYHRIDLITNNPWETVPLTPQDFDREVRYLQQRYRIVSLNELGSTLYDSGKLLPPNAVVITIDDGYKGTFIHAYPILKKYKVPATVFLATGNIGTGDPFWWDKVKFVIWKTKNKTLELGELGAYYLTSANDRKIAANTIDNKLKRYSIEKRDELIERLVGLSYVDIPKGLGKDLNLSWNEIKEMSKHGISFGAHTVNHPILTRVSLDRAKAEIIESKHSIERELGQEVNTFCYPNGDPDDYNTDIEEILKNNGFTCAVTTSPPAFLPIRPSPYELPRISGEPRFSNFEFIISGLHGDLGKIRGHLTGQNTTY